MLKHQKNKMTFGGDKKRAFWLSEDDELHWQKGKLEQLDRTKSKDYVRLSDVTAVLEGMQTDVLARSGKKKMVRSLLRSGSFSQR